MTWNFEDVKVIKYFGANLKKAKKNYKKEYGAKKAKFVEDYPYAKINEFEFWVSLSKKGEIREPTKIVYKADGETKLYNNTMSRWSYSWDIESMVFKTKYYYALYWGPSKIWEPTTSTKDFSLSNGYLQFSMSQFRLFVNERESFLFTTDPLDIKWKNEQGLKDITKAKVDKEDPYFAYLIAAYIISQKSDICLKHMREEPRVPNVVTSILRFYVYYHMKRFLRDPSKMQKYITKEMLDEIQEKMPTRKIWVIKTHHGKETISAWLATQPNKENIRNAKHYGGGIGGVLGIEYEELSGVLPEDEMDAWMRFIQSECDGITKTGQLFL